MCGTSAFQLDPVFGCDPLPADHSRAGITSCWMKVPLQAGMEEGGPIMYACQNYPGEDFPKDTQPGGRNQSASVWRVNM